MLSMQGWNPQRAQQLGADILTAMLAVLPDLQDTDS
jgi:hypothetical protein